uniref:Uncharacterized protein n=1 Tax=Leptobrachium leishanense TaxID=445787 RepID=A0A8C5MC15_9ANUR
MNQTKLLLFINIFFPSSDKKISGHPPLISLYHFDSSLLVLRPLFCGFHCPILCPSCDMLIIIVFSVATLSDVINQEWKKWAEFQECCNAGRYFLVTQENTHIGDNITYETRKDKHIEVTEKIHKMFPKTSLFTDMPIRSCAVVESGGILRNSCCGAEIDRADYIFRCNLAPMNYSDDIGTKTSLVTANPSILIERYSSLMERRKPFMDMIKTYEPAPVLMAAFSFLSVTDLSFRTYYTLKDFGENQTVIFYNPTYLSNIELYWKKKGLVVRRLSSGLMIVSTALEICDKVTLYGFWPFDKDTNGNPIPHHYYDNRPPITGVFSMPDEFFLYSQMHSKGILKLKVGKCF